MNELENQIPKVDELNETQTNIPEKEVPTPVEIIGTEPPIDPKKKKNKTLIRIAAFITVIIIIILLLLRSCTAKQATPPADSNSGFTVDSNVEEGGHNVVDKEAIEADLNAKVEASMINISMNTSPVFADSKAEGNLEIVNSETNNYPQVIEIYRLDTDELIYKSGAIPVGSKIKTAPLSVELPKGEYLCIAYFNAVDIESGEILGKAGANIKITVAQ